MKQRNMGKTPHWLGYHPCASGPQRWASAERTIAIGNGLFADTSMRDANSIVFADKVFEAELIMAAHTTIGHYDNLNFREALKYGWFDLQVHPLLVVQHTSSHCLRQRS